MIFEILMDLGQWIYKSIVLTKFINADICQKVENTVKSVKLEFKNNLVIVKNYLFKGSAEHTKKRRKIVGNILYIF